MNRYFDITRFWRLMKLEVFQARMGVLITLDIVIGLLFFGFFVGLTFDQSVTEFDHSESYGFTLLVGGFVLTSLAFNKLGNTLKSFSYLTLPVSTLERWLCMWILTTIGWVVSITIVFTLYTILANSIGRVVFHLVEFKPFDPFGAYALTAMTYYVVVQGTFLVGATHFKGYVFPKTLFTVLTALMIIGLVVFFSLKDIFLTDHECKGYECEYTDVIGAGYIWATIKFFFWYLLAPLTWVISFLGLKDKEV